VTAARRSIIPTGIPIAIAAACNGGTIAEAPAPPAENPDRIQPALRAAVPADWTPLPDVASAARSAAVQIRGVSAAVVAWGDPGDGCFLVALDVRGNSRDRLRLVVERLGWHLDQQARMHAWQVPATESTPGEASGRLTVGAMVGSVRAIVDMDSHALPGAALAACFHNDREPDACEAICARLLPLLQAPPALPTPPVKS
jgi:hypothetical protein